MPALADFSVHMSEGSPDPQEIEAVTSHHGPYRFIGIFAGLTELISLSVHSLGLSNFAFTTLLLGSASLADVAVDLYSALSVWRAAEDIEGIETKLDKVRQDIREELIRSLAGLHGSSEDLVIESEEEDFTTLPGPKEFDVLEEGEAEEESHVF